MWHKLKAFFSGHKVRLDPEKSKTVDINPLVVGMQNAYCPIGRNCARLAVGPGTEIDRCEYLIEDGGELYCTCRKNADA
jgi:hypothetical protein